MERRSEIYVTRKLAKRLRMVLKIYPQMIEQQGKLMPDYGGRETTERLMTVEELVERHLNKVIEDEYPVVIELEKGYAKLEREMAAHAKTVTLGQLAAEICETKTSGTKPPTIDDDSLKSSSRSLEDGD